MRIISGRFKGLEIKSPKNGKNTRPTTDRTKEAIFSHLLAIGALDDARVLDLYAGTGALGFEALSRGAHELTSVESLASVTTLIAQTASALKHSAAWEKSMSIHIVRAKVDKFIQARSGAVSVENRFTLVMMDPPYEVSTEDCNNQLAGLIEGKIVDDNATIMVERSMRSEDIAPPAGWEITQQRSYGETEVFYIEKIA